MATLMFETCFPTDTMIYVLLVLVLVLVLVLAPVLVLTARNSIRVRVHVHVHVHVHALLTGTNLSIKLWPFAFFHHLPPHLECPDLCQWYFGSRIF